MQIKANVVYVCVCVLYIQLNLYIHALIYLDIKNIYRCKT